MSMDESEANGDLQSKRLSLIDFSSEDDSLLFSCPVEPYDSNSSDIKNENKSTEFLECMAEDFGHREQEAQMIKEPDIITRNAKYNLRKSLAWDSAFFTSAGVLDPEEFSSMIEGVGNIKKHVLPGIPEDVHKSNDSISTLEDVHKSTGFPEDVRISTDSISTFGSDSSVIESIEANLFEDVRASIQKSCRVKAESGRQETRKMPSSRKADISPQNKMCKAALKKPSDAMQGPSKMTKQSPSCSQVSQPKVLGKLPSSSTTPTRRAFRSIKATTQDKANVKTAAGRGASGSKVHALGSFKNAVHKPAQCSTASKKEPTSSSFDSSESSSSGNSFKHPFSLTKRKTDAMTAKPPSSGSTRRTPSRVAARVKPESGNLHLSSYLISATKDSSGTSPVSSISEWSIESSSSATHEQRSNSSRTSLETASHKRLSEESDASQVLDSQYHANDRSPAGDTKITSLLHQSVHKASVESSGLPLVSMKPSGLRLPSPKNGFFDGVKSVTLKPNPVLPGSLPKIRPENLGSSGCVNKPKLGKLQPASVLPRSTKADNQNPLNTMNCKSPKPFQQSSKSAVKSSGTSRDIKTSGISTKFQNKMNSDSNRNNHSDTNKVGRKNCDVALHDTGSRFAQENDSFCAFENQMSPESNGRPDIRSTISCTDGIPVLLSQEKLCGEHMLKSDPPSFNNTNRKDEFLFGDQVDNLSRQVGAIDINTDSQKELLDDSFSFSQSIICSEDQLSASTTEEISH